MGRVRSPGLVFGNGPFSSGLAIDQSVTEPPPAFPPGDFGSLWSPADTLFINSRDLRESPAASDRLELVVLLPGGTLEFGFPDLPVIGIFTFKHEESRFEGEDLENIILTLDPATFTPFPGRYEEVTFMLSFTNPDTSNVESIGGSITGATVAIIPIPAALSLFVSALGVTSVGYSRKKTA